jgi:hypothetical protein
MSLPDEGGGQPPETPANAAHRETPPLAPAVPPPGQAPPNAPPPEPSTPPSGSVPPYAGPVPPYPGPPASQPPATRRLAGSMRWWVLGAAAAGLVLVVLAGVVVWVVVARTNSDEAKIQRLVGDFATAVDRDDQDKLLNLLCAEEARAITEDDDYDPANNGGPITDSRKIPVKATDIRVTGDTASARITRPSQPATTLYFRKEAGRWKVCAPAGDPAGATPTPTD